MGIQGLLQSLRPIQRIINISEYQGKTVAIDGHCILHRAGFGAATKLALNQPTDSYVNYFMQFMGLLEYHGITSIVVFDGLPLPLKRSTNDERLRNRQAALKQGLELYEQGKIAAAEKYFQQSVSISNEMITAVIRKLMEKKIQCIVAPNEADAQLTHLANTGKVDAVVTEDSDLLAFGCAKVIYKIDRYGDGIEICMDKVINDYKSVLHEYDAETIRHICILSGCDYLPSIKGVGLKTILKRYEINRNTDQALYNLQHRFKKDFPADYIEKFYFANLGFLHQWVYDIDEKNYVRLNPLPTECSEDDIKLLGRIPTVQDSTVFRVNKIIPKPKPKDNPLKESITEEFLAYSESAKENIMPSHLGSPFSATSPKSPKSPKSSTPSFGMKSRPVLSELKSLRHNGNTIPVADLSTRTSGEPSSYLSRPRVATQDERLEALYKRFGVLPRKPLQITSEQTTHSKNVADKSPSTSSPTDNSKPPSSESDSTSSRGIKNAFFGTNIGSAANLLTFYSRDRNSWKSYIKQKRSLQPPSLPSTVKRLFLRKKSKKDAPESPLSSSSSSSTPPPSSVEQPLMPLTETSTVSTTTQTDAAEPIHDYPISPPNTSPTEDEMFRSTTVNTSDTTASIDDISTSVREVSHDMDQTLSSQTCEVKSQHSHLSSPTTTSSEQNKASYNRHTRAKPRVSKWAQFVNTSPSPAYIPSNAHTNYLRSSTATSSNHDIRQYNQHTQAKPMVNEWTQSANTTPSFDKIPSNADTNYPTSNVAISIKDDPFICSQYKLIKFMTSKSAQSVNITPSLNYIPSNVQINHPTSNINASTNQTTIPYHQDNQGKFMVTASKLAQPVDLAAPSDLISSIAHINHSTSNVTKTAAATTAIEPPQNASISGKKENTSVSSSKHLYRDPRMSHSNKLPSSTHVLPSFNGEHSRKRSFDQTDHSASTIQGNSHKKVFPALPPPQKRSYRRR